MASNTFNGLEMIKIAIIMEEEGSKFYTNGAKNTEGELKEFLLKTAQQELEHKEKFTNMYNELLEKNEDGFEYLFDEEVGAYLKGLIENRVFDKKILSDNAFKNMKSALEYALNSERLTIQVYTKMYEAIRDGAAKNTLHALIKEEADHVLFFSKLLK